jgi:serine/threonine-protein kinase
MPGILRRIEAATTRKRNRSGEVLQADLPAEHVREAEPSFDASPPVTTRGAVDGVQRRIGDYDVIEEVAQGGMGVVFRARQRGLGRIVALKVLKDQLMGKYESVQRFQREARAASRMNHPNIVSIFEVGVADGTPFMTMDFIEGKPLDAMIEAGPLPPRRVAEIMARLADAMRYAHSCDVVHRDLKPSNVIIDDDGDPHITDFGLAKRLDSKSRLTETGALVGTPYYMAPEQIAGSTRVSKGWDLYALGVIMYEALTGVLPFDGDTTLEVYHRILHDEPIPPRQRVAAIPVELELICLKAMMREEALRYRSVAELTRDLDAFLAGRPVAARQLGRFGRWLQRFERNTLLYTVMGCALIIVIASMVILTLRFYRGQLMVLSAPNHAAPVERPR